MTSQIFPLASQTPGVLCTTCNGAGLDYFWRIAGGGSTVWTSANRAMFIPIEVETTITVIGISWLNGGTVSGNVDVGIYDLVGNLLISAGSTAQAGINSIQSVSLTATILSAGVYYAAMAMDNATGTINECSIGNAPGGRTFGIQQMASAFPLPNPATLVPSIFVFPALSLMTQSVL
jgi:hypothetical protein